MFQWFWNLIGFANKCRHCKRRYKSNSIHNYPTCIPCFMHQCKKLEERTGMVVGYGPMSDIAFRDDN